MKNGFYFTNNSIQNDYFLLKKINLIHSLNAQDIEQADFFYFQDKTYTFSMLSDVVQQVDLIIIFNLMTSEDLKHLKNQLFHNPKQKILFIPHILFDYQKTLTQVLSLTNQIIILTENKNNPYLVNLESISRTFLSEHPNIQNWELAERQKKISSSIRISFLGVVLKFILFQILKLFLKPVQFFKDFYATYNLLFFYGHIKVFIIKALYLLRHISIMSFVQIFHILKILCIKIVYGFKVAFIRFSYWIQHKLKMFFIYSFIFLKSLVHRFFGFLIWCYYRLEFFAQRLFWFLWVFNMNYTFYPIRKLYWFLSFQFQKRILGKIDAK